MTDWIEHNGGPSPVDDDVWVEALYAISAETRLRRARLITWRRTARFRILNQHLIDAARLEGIRLGLEAAHKEICALPVTPESDPERVQDDCADTIAYDLMINIDTIAKEAKTT